MEEKMDKKFEIQRIYYLLEGLKDAIEVRGEVNVDDNTISKYNSLINELSLCLEDNLNDYTIKANDSTYGRYVLLKLHPIINYLKNMYIDTSEYQIEKIGALYKSLEDSELKKRCEDILLGDDVFDRAINQATQVLEDRIKNKAGLSKSKLIGLPLVNKAIHKDLNETYLKFSNEPDIQEGYSNLIKGVISIYRNPTHHSLGYKCSREYALKTCAFIDDLLKDVENCEKIKGE